MLRLLKIELHKIKYSKTVKIISLVYFILISFIALVASVDFTFAGIPVRLADQGIFNFPYIWHFNTFTAALFKFFLAIVIVSLISNEYSYRTLKQNLIDGLSKKEFILSKFLTVILFSLVSTIFVFILSLILGSIFSDFDQVNIIFSNMEFLVGYFLKLVAFFSFCLFLAVMVKRSAFALGFLFVWWIFEKIVHGVLAFKVFDSNDKALEVLAFFPLESMYNLIPQPSAGIGAVQTVAKQLGEEMSTNYEITPLSILIVSVWTFLFIWWSYLILKKRDL